MNIEFTQKQIEYLSITRCQSFIVEQWPRFELLDEIMSTNENLLALVNNSEKELIYIYIKDYFPDDDCELIWYDNTLPLIIAYNFFSKSNFECLPLWDTSYPEIGYESGACLLIKREFK